VSEIELREAGSIVQARADLELSLDKIMAIEKSDDVDQARDIDVGAFIVLFSSTQLNVSSKARQSKYPQCYSCH